MACTVVFTGGDKLTFEVEPEEMESLLASTEPGPGGLVKIERRGASVFLNREHVLFIRPMDYGEVASP